MRGGCGHQAIESFKSSTYLSHYNLSKCCMIMFEVCQPIPLWDRSYISPVCLDWYSPKFGAWSMHWMVSPILRNTSLDSYLQEGKFRIYKHKLIMWNISSPNDRRTTFKNIAFSIQKRGWFWWLGKIQKKYFFGHNEILTNWVLES